MNELALFAGAGGGILGGLLHGWRTVAAVEIEDYPRRVLLQRQADGILPRFPIWDDVTSFDGRPWRGKVDVVSGGFPCQDISCAGSGAGIEGERSGLWSGMARIIDEVRPRYVFAENSPLLVSRGLGVVLRDLAQMGYDARWGIVGADDVGAPHRRKRIWIVADARRKGSPHGQEIEAGGECQPRRYTVNMGDKSPGWWDIDPADLPDADNTRLEGLPRDGAGKYKPRRDGTEKGRSAAPGYLSGPNNGGPVESFVGRVAHGVAHRVDRLKAIGNGQVPSVAAVAWQILTED